MFLPYVDRFLSHILENTPQEASQRTSLMFEFDSFFMLLTLLGNIVHYLKNHITGAWEILETVKKYLKRKSDILKQTKRY